MTTAVPPPPAGDDSLDHEALPAGTRFGELEILRVIGVGGFGIVYLAQDHALERTVALKEYMPGSLARRGGDQQVSMRSGAHEETYALGLRSFVNEARLLARFNHPSLVKVYRFWEANGTAYMVMPYLQGRTLRETRRAMSEPPTEAWIRALLDPLLQALALLHREDVFHRDIAPDNILLPPGEPPVLLDFGAARQAISGQTQTFTAILKPSYAPIEQYAEVVRMRQGPWTDLYALGAVVHYLLRGTPPPPATTRAVLDEESPLLPHADFPIVSPRFIGAVEWMLAIRPSDRPQSIEALREVLDGRAEVPPRGRPGITLPPVPRQPPAMGAYDRTQIDDAGAAEATAMHIELEPDRAAGPTADAEPRTLVTPPERTPPRHRVGRWIAALVVAGVAVGFGAWFVGSRLAPPIVEAPAEAADTADAVPDRAAAAAPVEPAASAVPSDAPGPLGALAPKPEQAPTKVPAEAPVAPAAAPAAKPAPAAPVVRAPVEREAPPATPEPPRISEPPAEPRRATAPPAAATPAPAPPTPAGPSGPEEACGSRVFLALALCMERECAKPRFKNHPECVPVREMQQRQRSPAPY